MPGTHAKYSASRAHRFMACAGSVVLEAAYPSDSNAYADEGTAAHTLAAACLEGGSDCATFIGETITVEDSGRTFTVDADMVRFVQMYVDDVRKRAQGDIMLVEVTVPIGHITGEQDATSVSDAIAVHASKHKITVCDLKYGRGVEVEAIDSEQGQTYALGALEACDLLGDFEEVEIVIFQPRISHEPKVWTISVDQLRAFGEKLRRACKIADAAEAGYVKDSKLLDSWAKTYLQPGEHQCRFCRAKASCPALKAEMMEIVGAAPATAEDFAQFVPAPVDADIGDNYLSMAMGKVGLVEDWCKAIRAEVERRMFAGQSIDGFKLVEGKQGNRAWVDADAVEAALKKWRVKQDEMYDLKLISPTTAEKLFKSAKPKWWAVLTKDHITRASGKPSVAPVSDKRPALSVVATAEDFSALVETEE